MNRVILTRMKTGDSGTFGKLLAPGFSCYTGELPWRHNRSKISCIPPGTYEVAIRMSPKFGRIYEIKGVRGRSYVLLHSGNFSGDVSLGYTSHVEGCVLLGNRLGRLQNKEGRVQDAVLASRPAVGAFMRAMDFQPFILEVIDPPKPDEGEAK